MMMMMMMMMRGGISRSKQRWKEQSRAEQSSREGGGGGGGERKTNKDAVELGFYAGIIIMAMARTGAEQEAVKFGQEEERPAQKKKTFFLFTKLLNPKLGL